MTPYYTVPGVTVYHGDCLAVMADLKDNSVDAIVTDPPYELSGGFMGKHWDRTGIAHRVDLWKEVLRVLKPGGHLVAFGGSRTYHRLACAIEDAGFDIRDQIQWLFGQGMPKSKNLDGEWKGWGTSLKPANEPVCLARKPLAEQTVLANMRKWGTGALNIDGCRIATDETLTGRWPANVCLSHDERCQMVGTQRIKGSRIEKPCPEPEIRGHRWGTLQQHRGPRGIGDAEGMETIDVWACADCAIKFGGKKSFHVCPTKACRDAHEADCKP